MKALIEKCSNDLNLLAKHVVSILTGILASNDLALSEHASPVFESFCKFHDGALFRGDPEYVQDFQQLVSMYLDIARGTKTGANELQWKLVGIQATQCITSSVAITTSVGKGHMEAIVPLLLSCLLLDNDGATLLRLHSQITTVESKRESRRMSIQISTIVPENISSHDQLLYTSMQALRHFFETSNTILLKDAVHNIVAYILNSNTPILWSTTLVEILTRCVPVQARFAVLTELVDELIALPSTNIPHQQTVAKVISTLLSSSVTMIGLSVIDILRSLLHSQLQILRSVEIATLTMNSPAITLVTALSDCIAALASHVYYATQISDMISEILIKCDYTHKILGVASGAVTPMGMKIFRKEQETLFGSSSNETRLNMIYLVNGLETIFSILSWSSNKIGGLEKSQLTISCWEDTQSLLNHENPEVRIAYSRALAVFLEHDSSQKDKSIKVSHDFDVADGPFGKIIIELFNLMTNPASFTEDYLNVYRVAFALIRNMGSHGIIRATSLAFMLEKQSKAILSSESLDERSIDQGLVLGSIALAILLQVGIKLDSDNLRTHIEKEIAFRKEVGLWFPPLETSQTLRESLKANRAPQTVSMTHTSVHNVNTIDQSMFFSAFSTRIPDFEPSMSYILERDYSVNEDIPIIRVGHAHSVDSVDGSPHVHRARSLRHLSQKLQNMQVSRLKPDFYLSSNNTDISLIGTATPVERDEKELQAKHERLVLKSDFTIPPITDVRRDFSPRVQDLKKAASGLPVRGNGDNSLYAPSASTDFARSEAASYGAEINSWPPANFSVANEIAANQVLKNPVEVKDFLSSLTVNDHRGRLV